MDVEGADPDGASDDGVAAGGDLLGEFDRFRGGLSSPFFGMVASLQGDGLSNEVMPSASKMARMRNLSSARRYPPDSGQDSKSKFFGFGGAPGRTSAHFEGWRGNARFPESRGFFSAVPSFPGSRRRSRVARNYRG